jgi:hypothetical protein
MPQMYGRLLKVVAKEVGQLRVVLEGLEAREKERVWLKNMNQVSVRREGERLCEERLCEERLWWRCIMRGCVRVYDRVNVAVCETMHEGVW